MKKTKELANVLSEEQLAIIRDSYPVEQSVTRMLLPRLAMYSQDVVEGKGKAAKVTSEAGTFYTEHQTDEKDENGKNVWEREEIGTGFEGIIVFQRRQLRFYDSANETYTSSPIYDNDEQIIPLFSNKKEVDRGTPAELKARKQYQGLSAKGKAISKLEENRVLYVLYNDELYQLTLRGTSMFAFMTYARKTLPPSVLTKFGSESKENGSIAWNQMTFEPVRPITQDEGALVQEKMAEMKEAVNAEKAFYSNKQESKPESVDDIAF